MVSLSPALSRRECGAFFMMKPIRISLAALIYSFIIWSFVYAQDGVFLTRYYCQDLDGHKRWEATAKIMPLVKDKNVYLLTEEGRGVYSGFSGPVSWKTEVEFFNDNERIIPLRMKMEVFSSFGKAIFRQSQQFNEAKGEVSCQINDLAKGRQSRKVFKFKGDIVNRFLLGMYVQRLLRQGNKEKAVYFISSEPSVYKIRLQVLREEEVQVDVSQKKAYKIYLNPDIGMLSVLKFVIPKTFIWHLSKPDFEWLKYRGLESSIGSPEVEIIVDGQ